jgi:hypothetical protein
MGSAPTAGKPEQPSMLRWTPKLGLALERGAHLGGDFVRTIGLVDQLAVKLIGGSPRYVREPRGIEHLELRLQPLGLIGELESVHHTRHNDVREQQVELHLLHENLQRNFGIRH